MSANGANQIRIELLSAARLEQTIALLEEIRPGIARLVGRGIYSAVCREALRDPRVTLVIAVTDGETVGYAGGISDWKAYWRHFLPRHPWLALLSIGSTILRKLRGREPDKPPTEAQLAGAREWLIPQPSGRSWETYGPKVAKVIGIGVSAKARGAGVGKRLYDRLMHELALRGVERADAMVHIENIASLKMHTKSNFPMELRGSVWIFGSRDCGLLESESVNIA
jgi:ribosomal protein S18 acetylase RimI-like enzyme